MDQMANMIGYDIFFIYFSWEFSPETRTGNMHWLSERKKWCQMKSVRRDPRDVNQEKWQNWIWFVNEKDNNSFVAHCLVTSSQIAATRMFHQHVLGGLQKGLLRWISQKSWRINFSFRYLKLCLSQLLLIWQWYFLLIITLWDFLIIKGLQRMWMFNLKRVCPGKPPQRPVWKHRFRRFCDSFTNLSRLLGWNGGNGWDGFKIEGKVQRSIRITCQASRREKAGRWWNQGNSRDGRDINETRAGWRWSTVVKLPPEGRSLKRGANVVCCVGIEGDRRHRAKTSSPFNSLCHSTVIPGLSMPCKI